MNKNVVRIQTELFKPGEVVRGHLISIYMNPPRNYVWYPEKPHFELLPDPQGAHTFGRPGQMLQFEDGALLFRFDALGEQADGFSKGDIDFLLQTHTAAELFGEDLPHFARQAELSVHAFKDRAWWASLAIYNVDVDQEKVEFDCTLSLEEATDQELVEATNKRAA